MLKLLLLQTEENTLLVPEHTDKLNEVEEK